MLLRYIYRIFFHWDTLLPQWIRTVFFSFIALFLFATAYRFWHEFSKINTVSSLKINNNWLYSIICVLSLSTLNWSFEAIKWYAYIHERCRISFFNSLKAVLFGTSLGIISPNRIGDFSGRSAYLSADQRKQGASATLFCSIAQNVATFLFGSIACFLFSHGKNTLHVAILYPISSAGIVIAFMLALLLFFPTAYSGIAKKILRERSLSYFQKISNRYTPRQNIIALGLSFFRYSLFIFQFNIIINLFAEVAVIQSFICMGTTYLINTLMPSNQLIELGVRTSVPIFILGQFGIAPEVSVLSSMLLWASNLGLPAIAGLLFRLRHSAVG